MFKRITQLFKISRKLAVSGAIDTVNEIEYYKNGGILQFVLRNMI